MKLSRTLSFKFKKDIREQILDDDNRFRDLSSYENNNLYIRNDFCTMDNMCWLTIDIGGGFDIDEMNIIEPLLNKYKTDMTIDYFYWSEGGGIDFGSYTTCYYYEDGVIKSIDELKKGLLECKNRDEIIEYVRNNNSSYVYVSDELKYDINFNLDVINSYDMLFNIPSELRMNRDIVLKCLTSRGLNYSPLLIDDCKNKDIMDLYIMASKKDDLTRDTIIYSIPDELYKNKEFVIRLLELDGRINYIYKKLDKNLKLDKDILDIFLNYWNCDVSCLPMVLRKDNELMEKLIYLNVGNLKKVSIYRNDRDFVRKLIDKGECRALEYASMEIRNDKEFVRDVMYKCPSCFCCASRELRNDKELVLEAIKLDSCNFYYFGRKLRDDEDVVMEALKHDISSFEYVSYRLKNNKRFVMGLLEYGLDILYYCGSRLKNDKDIIKKALVEYNKKIERKTEMFLNVNSIVDFEDSVFYHNYYISSHRFYNLGYCDKDFKKLFKLRNYELIIDEQKIYDIIGTKIIKDGYIIHPVIALMGDKLYNDDEFLQELIDILLKENLPF